MLLTYVWKIKACRHLIDFIQRCCFYLLYDAQVLAVVQIHNALIVAGVSFVIFAVASQYKHLDTVLVGNNLTS